MSSALQRRYAGITKNIMISGTVCAMLLAAPVALQARVVTVSENTVNVRQGASTETTAISKVRSGQVFGWCGGEHNWSKIRLGSGAYGYVRNDLLMGYDALQITGSLVRVRKTPSLSGVILTSLPKGSVLNVLDHQNGWFKVQFAAGIGWISGDYSKLVNPVVLSTTEVLAQEGTWQPDKEASSGSAGVDSGDGQMAPETPAAEEIPAGEDANAPSAGILAGKVIVVDPGHGNTTANGLVDPGTLGLITGIREKDINLDIALKLRTLLTGMGATVVMTHTGETVMNLYDRAAVASNSHADLFISIHANSNAQSTYCGHTTYFYAPADDPLRAPQRDTCLQLARTVQAELVKAGGRADLGTKESNFVVIRETVCPSILVETAFLSNPEEERLLAGGAYRLQLAQGLANGLRQYFSAS